MTIKAGLIGAAIGAVFVLWIAAGRRPAVTPLPPPLSRAVEAHQEERATDSAQIKRWRSVADSAHARELAALDRARRAESASQQDSARAVDLLAQHQLPLAYTARAAEAITLRLVVASEDSAVHAADVRAAVLDSGLARSVGLSRSADSLLAATVKVAEQREPPCRVVAVLPCPSRRVVAAGAAAFGFALAKGWVGSSIAAVARLK